KNLFADVRAIPFEDNYFDFVYDTCLCYVPECDVDQAIREIYRVTRHGVLFGTIVLDFRQSVGEADLFYGSTTLWTLWQWSERFLHNGFRLAVSNDRVLDKVWKIEKKSNQGDRWYPTRESMSYCFYTKEVPPNPGPSSRRNTGHHKEATARPKGR